MNKALVGKRGESVAASYLKKHGYEILERNLHVSHQEIDIIAVNREAIVFVEVKTRIRTPESADCYTAPAAAVTYQKQSHLLRAARTYLSKNNYQLQPRMDVIEVFLAPDDALSPTERFWEKLSGAFGVPHRKVLLINHIENAFGMHGYHP